MPPRVLPVLPYPAPQGMHALLSSGGLGSRQLKMDNIASVACYLAAVSQTLYAFVDEYGQRANGF
jgi:hypothetical protein